MGKPEAPPPSYDEAISSPVGPPPGHNQFQPPPQPPRPNQQHQQSHQQGPSQGSSSYNSQSGSGHYSHGPAHPSQNNSFHSNQQPPMPVNGVPWKYPSGYWCHKCQNTGKKLKNGKSCQKCWERFAPRSGKAPNVHLQTVYNGSSSSNFGGFSLPFANSGYSPGSFTTHSTTTSYNSSGPRYVQPGDPAIGGVQCGKCRGKGMVRFFLDEEHCPVCNGIGRVFV